MDKTTRNLISNATQAARRLLEQEFAQQLEGVYDILPDGTVAQGGGSLGPAERLVRDKIAAVLAHKRAGGKSPAQAVDDYLREGAFTCLNRFVALKMLEARELVRECVSRGDASSGFREFCGLAPGLATLPDKGYCLYVESLFDELSTEIKVLFDRHDPASLLWPRRQALQELLEILNGLESQQTAVGSQQQGQTGRAGELQTGDRRLPTPWHEDETIGWVYQYFNSGDERKKMREESQAPRNSRELAVRNQFFTPRYVVQFLTDNTLGRIWYEMRQGRTSLRDRCEYLVRGADEVFLGELSEDRSRACRDGSAIRAKLLVSENESALPPLDPRAPDATQRLIELAHCVNGYARHPFEDTVEGEWWPWPKRREIAAAATLDGFPTQDLLDVLFAVVRADRHGGGCGDFDAVDWRIANEVRRRALEAREEPPDGGRPRKVPTFVRHRPKMDPRDIRLLDPAGGSGHFLLYAFDLFLVIYEEARHDETSPASKATGRTLREDYPDLGSLRRALPALILEHNLHAVDIDPRCVQIAALALWMRAQRANRDFGFPAGERAPVTRVHIVVAEPMPGDAAMVDSFAATLEPPLLGALFKKMVDEMHLAGELGTLLRVEQGIATELRRAREQFVTREKLLRTGFLPGMEPPCSQGELDLSGIDDAGFFHQAEARILGALRRFAEVAAGGAGMRRRLFVGDAAQGVALVDLLQTHFDVVLMNPPFGLATPSVQRVLAQTYHGAHSDIFAAFLRRARELTPGGLVGAITSRSFLVAKRLEQYRRADILPHLHLLADLGASVMDGALVESAAFVLTANPSDVVVFSDVRPIASDQKPGTLAAVVAGQEVVVRHRSEFGIMPQARILYDLPTQVLALMSDGPRFEPTGGTAREGMKSFDNFRFVRLWWEVPLGDVGEGHRWPWLAKGGSHGFFAPDVHLVLNLSKHGAELQQVNLRLNGTTAQVRQASDYWYRPGATYSRRSARGFSARALPAGCVFTDKGPAVLPAGSTSPAYLLGWLNSRPIRALIHLQANATDFLTGILKSLPWKPPDCDATRDVEVAVSGVLSAGLALAARDETSPRFAGAQRRVFRDAVAEHCDLSALAKTSLDEAMQFSDRRIAALYRIESLSWADDVLGDQSEVAPDDEDDEAQADTEDAQTLVFRSRLSFAIGVALCRWSGPQDALPARAETVFDAQPQRPLAARATSSHAEVILADDPGASNDVSRACESALADILLTDVAGVTRLCESASGFASVRDYLRRDFWVDHLAMYSKSRRKAPIYWHLATPSASYSVWLYLHRVTKDTLFQVLNDVVAPKLAHEERQLDALVQSPGGSPTATQRRETATQEAFVDELRAFRDEVARVAPLWNPNLDDGVIINFAPLWRLVPQHKAWQRECKACWDKLVAGEYDWAHLAMHLWPERVVPKCATDRSLAIAHDLEEVFWEEDKDGDWQPRQVSQARVEELVQERTSPAVKAALQSLLDAPSPTTKSTKRPRRKAATT